MELKAFLFWMNVVAKYFFVISATSVILKITNAKTTDTSTTSSLSSSSNIMYTNVQIVGSIEITVFKTDTCNCNYQNISGKAIIAECTDITLSGTSAIKLPDQQIDIKGQDATVNGRSVISHTSGDFQINENMNGISERIQEPKIETLFMTCNEKLQFKGCIQSNSYLSTSDALVLKCNAPTKISKSYCIIASSLQGITESWSTSDSLTSAVPPITTDPPTTTDPSIATDASTTDDNRFCRKICDVQNITVEELNDMVKKLKDELRTNRKTTSNYIRSRTSAADDRTSSKAIGYIGVLILCVIGGVIVIPDFPILIRHLKMLLQKLFSNNKMKTSSKC